MVENTPFERTEHLKIRELIKKIIRSNEEMKLMNKKNTRTSKFINYKIK